MLRKTKILAVVVLLAVVTMLAASCCFPCFPPCYPCPPSANPSIDVEAFVGCLYSDTWKDADDPPGPYGQAGNNWWFKFTVTNDGDVTLANVTLSDSVLGLISLPGNTLSPGDSFEVIIGPVVAIDGQYESMATAQGEYEGTVYMDTDYIYYVGQ